MTTPINSESLHGKRILLVEEDDRLYCALKDALQEAGCETIGLLAHFPDASAAIPDSRIDAALVDVGWKGMSFAKIARTLDERSIPVLFIGKGAANARERSYPAKLLNKPFTEQELLDGMRETINATRSTQAIAGSINEVSGSHTDAKVLQVTCSHCGHQREFQRDERLTVGHLEVMSHSQCVECGAHGLVFGFISYPLRTQQALEALPLVLRLVGDAQM